MEFLMTKPVGGRGKKAPYETKIMRVPLPLVPHFESQIKEFRKISDMGISSNDSSCDSYSYQVGFDYPTLSNALVFCKQVLKSKQSARKSLIKLLQLLYKTDDISVNNLK